MCLVIFKWSETGENKLKFHLVQFCFQICRLKSNWKGSINQWLFQVSRGLIGSLIQPQEGKPIVENHVVSFNQLISPMYLPSNYYIGLNQK